MKYKDFKAVYLEKKVSLEAWKSSLEGGKRIAKVAGRNVKIPANVSYKEWRENPYKWSGLKFDAQRFSDYDKQVARSGGSGNIKPDAVHSSHSGKPRQAEPLQIITQPITETPNGTREHTPTISNLRTAN